MRKSWVVSSQYVCVWRTCINEILAQTRFLRTLTKTIYISVIFSTLNLILSVANLSKLECAEISFARKSRLYEYMSCNACTKTLLSFCVYKQRLCHVFAMYMIAMHVNWSDKAKNRSIYCILQTCRCAKAESCLRNVCVNVVYKLNAEPSTVTALCVIVICVNRSENEKNRLICCITQVCRCVKAKSCLCNVCMCDVYELQRMRKDVAIILCI